jgi:hypothetical protein
VSDRKDDPAFIYFPTNYRWSMGLLLCLSAAPWGGAEIDEVNRVGRALRDKVGDDDAWFEEWTRMGDKIEARGRAAEKDGHKLTAASCFLRATRYYQTGERFLQPKSQRGMDVYAKSVKTFRDAAALIRSPRIEHVEIPFTRASQITPAADARAFWELVRVLRRAQAVLWPHYCLAYFEMLECRDFFARRTGRP